MLATEGLPRLLRHGAAHFPGYARLLAAHYAAAGAELLSQVGAAKSGL